jgi:L-threonylcarbamoyladenylate synthase
MLKIKLNENNWEEVTAKAIEVLNDGLGVIYPTETCYGIAVDATNDNALNNLLAYKTFRGSKPISIAVTDIEMANKYVDVNEMAKNIYDNYLPGPITVISRSKGILNPPVVSKEGGIGIRIPDYPFILELIKQFDKPITATSANASYKPHPYSIEQLEKELPKKSQKLVGLCIDAGELQKNVPSTVIDTTMNSLAVLREGRIQFEQALIKSKLLEKRNTTTPEETINMAKEFTKKYLNEKVVVALSGELGAGKTQFTKGIGEYLGVKEIINSPTYTIINEYSYLNSKTKEEKILAHMDTWRLTNEKELKTSGMEQHLKDGNILVIEWADKFYQELNDIVKKYDYKTFKVNFKYLSLTEREISIYGEE